MANLKNNKIENLPIYYVNFFINYHLRLNRLLSLIGSEIVSVDYDFDLLYLFDNMSHQFVTEMVKSELLKN
jgi:hypothetical protein